MKKVSDSIINCAKKLTFDRLAKKKYVWLYMMPHSKAWRLDSQENCLSDKEKLKTTILSRIKGPDASRNKQLAFDLETGEIIFEYNPICKNCEYCGRN